MPPASSGTAALGALLDGLAADARLSGYVARLRPAFPAAPASLNATLVEPLSDRELEVLRLLAQGLSNAQIAARLVVAVGTVKTHIHNIYGKLGAQNRAQAVTRATELKLLQ